MIWVVIAVLPYFLVFLFLWTRKRQLNLKQKSHNTETGNISYFFSVIIPLRNEAVNLPELINDLSQQSLGSTQFEILFVDDNSTDSTREIFGITAGDKGNFRMIESQGKGKKAAIALGIEKARGEYIVTTDGDCRVGKDWLKSIYCCVQDNEPDMIIGAVDIMDTGTVFNRIVQLEFLSLQAVTEMSVKNGIPLMCNGANLCFRNPGAERYLEMVNPKIRSGDDIFLMESFKQEGKIIIWNDSAKNIVSTYGPDSVFTFFRQRIRWVSKSPYYRQPVLLFISALVFLTNLLIASTLIASIFIPGLWLACLSMFLIKSVPDLILIGDILDKRKKQGLLILFIPVQLIYPFYVIISGLSGIIKGLFSSQLGR